MKKILICNYKIDIVSGAEKAIVDMILPLKDEFDFTMFVPGEGSLSQFYREQGLKVVTKVLSNKRRKYPGLHLFHSYLFSKYLKKEKYDFVLCNTFFASNKIATAMSMTNIPFGIFVREYFNCNDKNYSRFLKTSDVIFAVSNDVKESLNEYHQNIVVTHDYINTKLINSKCVTNDVLPSNSNHKYKKVVLIGRVTPYKQQDLFINAFNYVKEKYNNVEFYIVGESSKKETYWKNGLISKSKGLDIHFLGNRNDVYNILPLFDISCMVSNREPFPRTILESQYLKVPVVASNTGGALEMIEDNETGIFFDVINKDERILADKIVYLLENEQLLEKIKNNAYEKLLKTFATEQPLDNFKKMIESSIKDYNE